MIFVDLELRVSGEVVQYVGTVGMYHVWFGILPGCPAVVVGSLLPFLTYQPLKMICTIHADDFDMNFIKIGAV